jgi:predicted dehydrogenase
VADEVRVGIIGAGYWAAYFYLPFLEAHPRARCVGVVRRNTDALAALGRAFNLEVATTDVDELLAAGCDGVIVASAHAVHREHAQQALEYGCDVLVEKPMTVSLDDAVALSSVATTVGKMVTIAYGWNYNRMASWAIDLVQSGQLGEVRSICGTMASSLVPLYSGLGGYGKIVLAGYEFEASSETYTVVDNGGGYLYGQTSHLLGLGLALAGSPPAEVFATMTRLPNGVDIDDSLSVRFADGSVGSFFGSGRFLWGARYPFDFKIIGNKGSLFLDFATERAEVYFHGESDQELFTLEDGTQAFVGRPPDEVLDVSEGEGLYSCDGPAHHFLDHCLGVPTTERADVALGVRTVAIMEAAARSAKLNVPVQLSGV